MADMGERVARRLVATARLAPPEQQLRAYERALEQLTEQEVAAFMDWCNTVEEVPPWFQQAADDWSDAVDARATTL